MRAKFIENGGLKIAIQFKAESDDEGLLLRAFDRQIGGSTGMLRVNGWGSGDVPGYSQLRIEQDDKDQNHQQRADSLFKRLNEISASLADRDRHANQPCAVPANDDDARKLCTLLTHDMALPSSTTTELALATFILNRIGEGWHPASQPTADQPASVVAPSNAACDQDVDSYNLTPTERAKRAGVKIGRAEMLAEIKAEPFKFLRGPAPYPTALIETFAIEFSITPATARALVTAMDIATLSDDELSAGGEEPARFRITIKGNDFALYIASKNELGEPTWNDISYKAPREHYHGLYFNEQSIIATAFRFLTLTRRDAGKTIYSIGEF